MLQALLILLAVLLVVRMLRQRSVEASASTATDGYVDLTPQDLWDHEKHPYHSVACKCANRGCKAVDPFKGHYHLVGDSHVLPIPECRAVPCRCRYLHCADRRRADEDRRRVFSLESEIYRHTHERDRRVSLGRRQEDWAEAGLDEAVGQR